MVTMCLCGCRGKEHTLTDSQSKWRNDTVVNTVFFYMPDTCIIDKDLFMFATNLVDIERIYLDSTINIECYKEWFNNTSSHLYCELYRDRSIEIDSCIEFIRHHLIPEIRRNGTNCTAAIAEAAWLEFGMNQYLASSEFELRALEAGANFLTWWLIENDAWLNFMTNLFPLLEYEICNVTGSSAAYEIPFTFSNISRFRTKCLADSVPNLILAKEPTTNNILGLIEGINSESYSWERDSLTDNIAIYNYKKCAIESLQQWVEIRKGMSDFVDNPNTFNHSTANLIDSISTTLRHILY